MANSLALADALTLIAAVAIPTSIVGSFTLMKTFGFSLNNMTMLALSLATGIVIDDAIVVLENIFRYVEEDHVTPYDAAIKATEEIGLAVLATTLSLCVIFLPVAFMKGIIGRFFFQFGVTISVAVLLSLLEALTLAPMRCSRFLEMEEFFGTTGRGDKAGIWSDTPSEHPEFRDAWRRKLERQAKARKAEEMG